MTQSVPVPDEEDLTVAQLQILEMIREDPEAAQKELAEQLDITSSAVSNRLREISGFAWKNRKTFIDRFFDRDGEQTEENQNQDGRHLDEAAVNGDDEKPTRETSDSDQTETSREHRNREKPLEDLADRLQDVEEKLNVLTNQVKELQCSEEETGVTDPDLIRKLVLTLGGSDRFNEDEESRLLDLLIE